MGLCCATLQGVYSGGTGSGSEALWVQFKPNQCEPVTTSSPALPLTSGKRFPTAIERRTSATLCTWSPGHTPTWKTTWGTLTWNTGSACDTCRTDLHLGASPPGCVDLTQATKPNHDRLRQRHLGVISRTSRDRSPVVGA